MACLGYVLSTLPVEQCMQYLNVILTPRMDQLQNLSQVQVTYNTGLIRSLKLLEIFFLGLWKVKIYLKNFKDYLCNLAFKLHNCFLFIYMYCLFMKEKQIFWLFVNIEVFCDIFENKIFYPSIESFALHHLTRKLWGLPYWHLIHAS